MDNKDKVTGAIEAITQVLTATNIAVPLISATVFGIVALIKAVSPDNGMTLLEVADLVEAQLDENDVNGREEVARLKAKLAGA